jgi:hypothetical protein
LSVPAGLKTVDSIKDGGKYLCHYPVLKFHIFPICSTLCKGDELSSLTAIFGNSEEKTQDSDKLMDLYWNRAELKKEFAGMRKEQYRLKDQVKDHEGRTARLQQRLDHLEGLLVDPDWAHNVVVYYQLRGLGDRLKRKLARFAEQLKQQREEKKHRKILADWSGRNEVDARDVEANILEKRDQIQQLEDQLQLEQHRLTSMSAWVRFFRGRSVMKLIDVLANRVEVAVGEEKSLRTTLAEIEERKPPDNQGLDVMAKRSINLMIVAFAQQLYIHFEDAGIARQIKESTEKSVGAINYGNQCECTELLETIQRAVSGLEDSADFAKVLKKRAKLLGEKSKYPSRDNAVPLAGTVSTLYRIERNGVVSESEANVAGENYWGISQIYSR